MQVGTKVRTVQQSDDWLKRIPMVDNRQWGVEGRVLTVESSGFTTVCQVKHPDGSIGHYIPAELAPIPQWARRFVRLKDGRTGVEIGGQGTRNNFRWCIRHDDDKSQCLYRAEEFEYVPDPQYLERFRALPEAVQVDMIEMLYQAMHGRGRFVTPIDDLRELAYGGGWTFEILT